MISELKHVEEKLIWDLLQDPSKWQSLDVDYHPPRVERVWIQLPNKQRLMLHAIHPCERHEALYHPHPWPSAMHIIKGKYEMGLGFKHRTYFLGHVISERHVEICKIEFEGDNYYEMCHKRGWHYVRPIDEVCYTVMLIGPPWNNEEEENLIKPKGKLEPLDEDYKIRLIEQFKLYYSHKR